jgi:hypothetical protein
MSKINNSIGMNGGLPIKTENDSDINKYLARNNGNSHENMLHMQYNDDSSDLLSNISYPEYGGSRYTPSTKNSSK